MIILIIIFSIVFVTMLIVIMLIIIMLINIILFISRSIIVVLITMIGVFLLPRW